VPTLGTLPIDAMRAEIRRQVNRAEIKTRRALGENGTPNVTAGDVVAAAFLEYHQLFDAQSRKLPSTRPADADEIRAKSLRQFVTLCQTASFLARGRSS